MIYKTSPMKKVRKNLFISNKLLTFVTEGSSISCVSGPVILIIL